MIHIYPPVWVGTLASEAIRIVGIVPKSGKGLLVRRLDLYTTVQIEPHPNDYWAVDLGTVVGAMEFVSRYSTARPMQGLAAGRNEMVIPRPMTYDVGEQVALRVRPVGEPDDLAECQIVVGLEEA